MTAAPHPAVLQAMHDTGCCTEEIVWPTFTGWTAVRCWKTGPHDIHTDNHGAPLCSTDEARLMRQQHALCSTPRRWTGLIA